MKSCYLGERSTFKDEGGLISPLLHFFIHPKETHPPKKNKNKTKQKKNKKTARKIFHFLSQRFLNKKKKKIVINFEFLLFPPDFGKFEDKKNIFFSSIFSYPTLMAIFSRGHAKRRNDYCCGAELCKCVTHSDVKKSICRRQPD